GRRVRAAGRLRLARAGLVPNSFESRVVWVFGSPRSGSTWLLGLLAEHPAVVPVNEPLIGDYLAPFLSDLPGALPEGLDSRNFTIRMVRDDADHMFSAETRDVWMPLLGKLLRGRFFAHAVRHPARVSLSRALVVIKEPNGSQSADLIMAAMPRARLLFLLRDGRDVVDSELAANLRGSWVSKEFPGLPGIAEEDRLSFVVQSAHKWLWRTEVVQAAFDAHRGPKHLVRYEELLRDPVAQLQDLFRWLEIDLDDEDLRRWTGQHSFEQIPADARGPQAFFRAAEPGRWRESLTGEEQATVDRIIGRKLRDLGYKA
ncbi:MAG: hypothetical protein QOI55_2083, partial [Actinomycetota bacterium]|nr:hypothetical protein [Actinomycetota bacterium]